MQNIVIVLGIVALLLCGYLGVGAFALKSGSLNVEKNTGFVWNDIATGGEKIGRLEAQVMGAYDQQDEAIQAIVSGRRAFDQAVAEGDIDAASQLGSQLAINVQALTEANPVVDLTSVQIALIDETAEAFNKISYSRDNLIEAQASYSMTRFIFFPIAGFFPDVEILGSNSDPAQPMPTSIFVPTAAQ